MTPGNNCSIVIMAINVYSLVLCLFSVVNSSPINEDASNRNITCGENEVFTTCKKLCPEPTCKNKDFTINCFAPDICEDGCNCIDGYWRAGSNIYTDRCVPASECTILDQKPVCDVYGEEYSDCGSACEVTCDNHEKSDRVCIAVCKPGCFCEKGKIRGPDGSCVYPHDCPSRPCRDDERFTACGTCEKDCNTYDQEMLCIAACIPGCYCKDGKIRGHDGTSCVLPTQCSKNSTVTATESPAL